MPPFTVYPNAIDSSDQLPITVDNITPVRSEVVNRQRDAIIAIESELGIEPSGTYTTVRARLDALETLIGAGGAIAAVLDEGSIVRENVKFLNFIGPNVSAIASATPNGVDIIITGGGGGGALIQEQETIAVTSNGQTAFVLTQTPLDSTAVEMYVNGLKQEYGTDYTAVAKNVTYASSVSLKTTDIVEFWYIVSGGPGSGYQTLNETLGLGNVTGGYNIELTGVDAITSDSSLVNINDNLNVAGDATINGKLTVTGLIDPTGLVLDEQAARPYDPTGQNKGLLWVDSTTTPNKLFYTDDSGIDTDLTSGGASSLDGVLATGNTTNGNNIVITSGDEIQGENTAGGQIIINGGTAAVNNNGGFISLTAADGNGTGNGGDININAGNGGATGIGGTVNIISGSGVGGDGDIILDAANEILALSVINLNLNKITNLGTPSNSKDAVNKQYVDGLTSNVITFKLTGVYSGAGVPGTFEPPYLILKTATIQSVSILRRNAGISGTTRVDILKNGTSIFANDGAKPQVSFGDGNLAIDTVSVFVSSSLLVNDYLDVILETAEGGSAEDLIVLINLGSGGGGGMLPP